MRIAVAYGDEGEIFPQFGRAEQFKFYDIEDGSVVAERILETEGNGQRDIVTFLAAKETDALICDGIGEGARALLEEESIEVYGGVEYGADEAVQALLAGELYC